MAKIDLQRKSGATWWPWVVGLLVLLLLVWLLAQTLDPDAVPVGEEADTVVPRPQPPTAVAPAPDYPERTDFLSPGEARAALPGSVQEYSESCTQAGPEPGDMGLQHEFTVRCMRLMAASFDAAIQGDTVGEAALDERLETLRSNAQRLEASDPSARDHAGIAAETVRAAAELLATLRRERYPDDQQLERSVRRAQDAAQDMDRDRPLLEQQDAVEEFFQAAGEALRIVASP